MKNNNKTTVTGIEKKIQDMIQPSHILGFQNAIDIASKNQMVELAANMRYASHSISRSLEYIKGMAMAYKDPTLGLQTNMQYTLQSISHALGSMKDITISYNASMIGYKSFLQETLKSISPALESLKEMAVIYKDPMLGLQANMQDIFNSISPSLESLKTIMIAYKDPMLGLKAPMQHISSNIAGTISSFSQFIQKLPEEKVILNKDKSVSCGAETLNPDDLQEIVSDILHSMDFPQLYDKVDNYGNKIIREIRKLKKPFLEKIIIYFIIPLIVTFLSSLFSIAIKNYYDYDRFPKNQIVKKIKDNIPKSDANLKLLREYRLVTANKLNVRLTNRKTSNLIGIIYFGQVVRVICKKGSWTLVEYKHNEDSLETTIKGWVFSRYLNKL